MSESHGLMFQHCTIPALCPLAPVTTVLYRTVVYLLSTQSLAAVNTTILHSDPLTPVNTTILHSGPLAPVNTTILHSGPLAPLNTQHYTTQCYVAVTQQFVSV